MKTLKDLHTQEEFEPKRSNQKFKAPANRIAFYNEKAKALRMKKAALDKPLHKNYLILEEIMSGKKEKEFHKEFLLGKGFTFEVMTHAEWYDGEDKCAIYNFIFFSVDELTIKIVRND